MKYQVVPEADEFRSLAANGAAVPVLVSIENSGCTPQQAYRRLRGAGHSFLLESGGGNPKLARYSIIGIKPFLIFSSKGRSIELSGQKTLICTGNPLDVMSATVSQYRTVLPHQVPLFASGVFGFFAYDVARHIEVLPDSVTDDLGLPEVFFMFCDRVVIFDHLENKLAVAATIFGESDSGAAYNLALDKARELADRVLCFSGEKTTGELRYKFGPLSSTHSEESYACMVKRCKEYIAAGDIFQANLSQRLAASFSGDPFDPYCTLMQINPSPFAFFLDGGSFHLASSSPERLIRLQNGFVQTRPIAGTRPRGSDHAGDEKMARELFMSPKELAEHVMIVDMSRNDIGRVCKFGTVRPDEFMVLEHYSHVMHIVSNIVGYLRPDCGPFELFKAVFPGASITGTPKVRCMEIIDELEDVRRGPYTGSAGWISFAGEMDLNIIIRTFVLTGGNAYIQVGGGVVADSEPEHEYQESLHKAQALIEALRKSR